MRGEHIRNKEKWPLIAKEVKTIPHKKGISNSLVSITYWANSFLFPSIPWGKPEA